MNPSHPHSSEKERAAIEVAAKYFMATDPDRICLTRDIKALLAQSHQSAEAALLLPVPYKMEQQGDGRFTATWEPTVPTERFPLKVRSYSESSPLHAVARLKELLVEYGVIAALKPPKEEDAPSAAVAEVRRVREANEAFYKEHGHYWYEECDNYSIECAFKKEDV